MLSIKSGGGTRKRSAAGMSVKNDSHEKLLANCGLEVVIDPQSPGGMRIHSLAVELQDEPPIPCLSQGQPLDPLLIPRVLTGTRVPAVANGQPVEFFLDPRFVDTVFDPIENATLSDGTIHKFKNQSTKVLVASCGAGHGRQTSVRYNWHAKSAVPPGSMVLIERTIFSGFIKW